MSSIWTGPTYFHNWMCRYCKCLNLNFKVNFRAKATHKTLQDCFCSPHEKRNRLATRRCSPEQMEVHRIDDVILPATEKSDRCLFGTIKVDQVDHVAIDFKEPLLMISKIDIFDSMTHPVSKQPRN